MTSLRAMSALALALLAALALVACGGSSGDKASTGSTTARTGGTGGSATTTTAGTKAPSAAATAYRKCLEAHGAGLPRFIKGRGGVGAVGRGYLKPPKGVSQATYDAAVRACGGNEKGSVAKAIDRFVACMRAQGVKVSAPSAKLRRAGKGGFSAYFGDFNNPKFSPALKKCQPILNAAVAAG
jgi:hypothetical protein